MKRYISVSTFLGIDDPQAWLNYENAEEYPVYYNLSTPQNVTDSPEDTLFEAMIADEEYGYTIITDEKEIDKYLMISELMK